MALALCVQEVSMGMNVFKAIGLDFSVKVFSDNLDNPIITQRSKHIDIKYHFVREFFKSDYAELSYLDTNYMQTDVLTKPLSRPKFTELPCQLLHEINN